MNKRITLPMLLLVALLLLCFTACDETMQTLMGQTEPPEEPEAGVCSLPEPYYLAFVPGETAEQDIDGDGKTEEVRVWIENREDDWYDVYVSVDGSELMAELIEEGDGYGFIYPDDQCWLLTDLDTGDGMLEIAIQDWGPSDDLTTSFYRYESGKLKAVGMVEGFVCVNGEPSDVTFNGQGTVSSYLRFSVLQTWWGKAESYLDESGMLVLRHQEYYESDAETPHTVTVIRGLFSYDAPNGTQDLLAEGTELKLLGTDDVEWVQARRTADGQVLWLHLNPDNPFEVETPDGFVGGWEILNGLFMAD